MTQASSTRDLPISRQRNTLDKQQPAPDRPQHDQHPHVLTLTTLGASLAALWLLLSGHYNGLLLTLGLVSVLLVGAISVRMGVAGRQGLPLPLHPLRLLGYWIWLLWAIIKASIAVCRVIVQPRLPVQPSIVRTSSSQTSQLGRVLYANSITLTPGTLTIDVAGDEIMVHTLTRATAEELQKGRMDHLAAAVERRVRD